jgi:hypothetical protein
LLRQWIAKRGYVPIVLVGMAGLAPEIGTGEWKSVDTIEAKPPVVVDAPVVVEAFVDRWPPTLETKAAPKPRMQMAAPDPDARLLDESDRPSSKGYIMYANSPTHWTPVPLPDEISDAAHAPHNNNIRAEIEQAAKLFDVDVRMMKAFAKIESGYNPKAKTGRYNACSSFPTGNLPNTGGATSTTSATAQSRRPESLRRRRRSSRRTSVGRPRRQKSIASTSKAIKAVRFITPHHTN